MQQTSLLKYKIGFIFVGIFVVVVLFLVISQAQDTKDDTATYNRVVSISNSLNQFINADTATIYIPSTLGQAYISNVPSTISYQKLSSDSYKFCVDYKTSVTDFSPSAVATGIITNTLDGSNQTTGDNEYLYISPDHHKGNNCQIIKPYLLQVQDPLLQVQDPPAPYNSSSNTSSI
jgi:hypothetical protein